MNNHIPKYVSVLRGFQKPKSCRYVYVRNILIRFILIVQAFLFCNINLTSQIFDYPSPRIKQFTLEDGLSQVSTNDLIRDQNGLIWIATQDGLNRFDGSEFINYKYSESDTTSISGNLINKLLEDQRGQIWIGTVGNGLNYFEPNSGIFNRVSLHHSSRSNEIITSIEEADNGTIWVASRLSGLHRLTPIKNQNTYEQSIFLSDFSIGALLIDKTQNLWAGTTRGDLYKIKLDDEKTLLPKLLGSEMGHIQALYYTNSHLLIGSDIGFFIYEIDSGQINMIELEMTGAFKTRHVLDFLRHDSSTVWIATGNGLYLFDLNLKSSIGQLQNTDQNGGLSNNTVQALLAISDDKILVGTANYLNLVDFSQPYFNTISKNKRGQHLLNDNVIFSIFKDEHGLWIGTSDGGLNLIRDDIVYHITEDENVPTSITGSVVRAIVKDEINQRLWIGTTRGLSLLELKNFDPEDPQFIVFHHDPNIDNSINSDFIKDLALDHDNNIWGATYGEGVFRLELDDFDQARITRFKYNIQNSNSLVNNFAQCIRVDRNNEIWVGTQGGCSHLSISEKSEKEIVFKNYYKDPDIEKSLSHNSVYDILFDHKDQVWLATRHGLNLLSGNNEFDSWTEQEQFPNAVIYSIQDDEDNNLWLGTNDGLVRFDPEYPSFAHYSVDDGIQSPEFDIHARYRDAKGNIYMGGIAGVTYFNPAQLKNIDIAIPLYFSKLRVKSDEYNSFDNTTEMRLKPMSKNIDLIFEHNQFPFYLEFSSLDYRLKKNVTYAYKLQPNDENWNVLDDTKIQFLNLNSGDYKLLVNGFSRGKEWKQKPLELNLSILPPWWDTWWAYFIYICLILTVTYLIYRFTLSRQLAVAESLKLKELDALRDRFYSNITHEFRTPLTVISGMADELGKNFKKEPDKKINLIKKNSQSLLTLVNQMLDLSKLKAGKIASSVQQCDVISFLKYVTEAHQSFAKLKEIGLQFYSEEEELVMDFDAYQLEQVLNNLISNAVKFTDEYGSILMVAKKSNSNNRKELEIKVKDNGIGISEEQLPFIFDRYHQVNPIHGNQGTGIGLALVKELTGLMNGQIRVESVKDKGTTFILSFPINNQAPIGKAMIQKTSELTAYLPNDNSSLSPEMDDYELPLLLIIEDNPDVTYYLQSSLEVNYKIITSSNGKLGLQRAFDILPDIIISDVMMPEMDGIEVCKNLKKDERTNHIPVILLTAKATTEAKLAGLTHGADAYLIKPFKKDELMVRMENLMDVRRKLQAKYSGALLTSQKLESTPTSKEAVFIKNLEEVILTHLDDEQFSIQHLSRELSLSRSQLHRKIKALTGLSTSLYIRNVRLQKAKELLDSSEKTVSEIAYEVGFKTPSYFSQAFKESFGESPSATRI